MEKDIEMLMRATAIWDAWSDFRKDRKRNKRYTYGNQWDDRVTVEGETMTEEEYIRRQGSIPLKNNLIRRLVRNVLGVYRQRITPVKAVARDPREAVQAEVLNLLLDSNAQINRLEELNARTLEEFLISGLAVYRKWYGNRQGKIDCWTDYVHPDTFFADVAQGDFRGWDVPLVGQVHDMSFGEVCSRFASGRSDVRTLEEIYAPAASERMIPETGQIGVAPKSVMSFLSAPGGMCRVIEVWERKFVDRHACHDPLSGSLGFADDEMMGRIRRENGRRRKAGLPEIAVRWMMQQQWEYTYLAPDGTVLRRQRSPYAHGGHPFVFKAYPFIDGEIHSFVGDVIDQQRYTNRLITLYDWIMRASAKGVLLFPEGALPDGVELRDIAREWSRFNGVIMFRPKAGVALPQQVSSNATNIGISELLGIQMKMFEDISGVNSALQGKLESGSTSGTLFDQQTRNALTSLQDLLESYRSFLKEGAVMDAKNIRQFYTKSQAEAIAGPAAHRFLAPTPAYGNLDLDFRF